ncbi:DNAse I-like superfamily protein [Tasmannia lanceolata]|uniref:DNAse I-like superfamily protein n=1 Tax=Tasmannia lanceolata TaxID=3420 RepID=UPI0040634425
MRLAYLSLQSFAAAAAAATMSSRFPSRGRNPWRRGLSGRSGNDGEAFVSGDSHFRTVRDSNYGFCQVERGNYQDSGRFPQQTFHQRPNFRPPPQQPPFRSSWQRPPFRPPPQRPDDYRSWEWALSQPPSHTERFVVLSYNILADYLARDHRPRLYFHIPPYVLDWEWRKRKILVELRLWDPDILCFQEVDRFQDLEEELKLQGYSGIWKMRTGKPIDGCAVFWRTTRFKLLHEEHIEFNNLGLRDNVAQICVFESRSQSHVQNGSGLSPTSSRCPRGANQVVICNIHVLYNPNRGEIKLAQVRVLLERAHAVSRIWNDAPVVVCGDFNCTPKSPLYNFISEQKLNLSGLAKNQVSGQSSARIDTPWTHRPNHWAQSPSVRRQSNFCTEMNSQCKSEADVKNENLMNNSSNSPKMGSELDLPGQWTTHQIRQTASLHKDFYSGVVESEQMKITDGTEGDHSITGTSNEQHFQLNINVSDERVNLKLDLSSKNHEVSPRPPDISGEVNGEKSANLYTSNPVGLTPQEDTAHADMVNFRETASSFEGNVCYTETLLDEKHVSTLISDGSSDMVSETSFPDGDGISYPDAENLSSELMTSEVKANLSTCQSTKEGKSLVISASAYPILDHHIVGNKQVNFEVSDDTVSPFTSQMELASNGVNSDSSLPMNSEATEVETNTYNPYIWTPTEIAMASGNAEQTLVEHHLKLKSAYAEVEDYSGTKDSSREPQITSYNRQFMGTVDYIWCSEGLKTVRVLDTIPKYVLQRTPGFPTRKWGSDHLALACQLAFTTDLPVEDS